MEKIKVIDGRKFGYFRIDNDVILTYGKDLGPYALSVYMVLCLHADNKSRVAWPSTRTMANLLSISRNTVMTSIQALRTQGLIKYVGKRGSCYTYKIMPVSTISGTASEPLSDSSTTTGSRGDTGGSPHDTTGSPREPKLYSEQYLELTVINNDKKDTKETPGDGYKEWLKVRPELNQKKWEHEKPGSSKS